MSENMLEVRDLTMHYKTSKGEVSAINNVSFDVKKGQSLGLVGESGCGKTSIAFSLIRLLPDNAVIKNGSILLEDENLAEMDKKEGKETEEEKPDEKPDKSTEANTNTEDHVEEEE